MVLLLGFGLVFLFLLRASLHPRSLVIILVIRSMDFNGRACSSSGTALYVAGFGRILSASVCGGAGT